jgi:stage V sporulation protein R
MLTNFGQPAIAIEDGNFENRGELLLVHKHDGVDLKLDYARDTLRNVQLLWRRPVNLVTRLDGRGTLLRFDGKEHSDRRVDL